MVLNNVGLWSSSNDAYSAFIYLGDVNGPTMQLSVVSLPALSVNSVYEIFPIASISDISGGYLWVLLGASNDTDFANANRYTFALYPPLPPT